MGGRRGDVVKLGVLLACPLIHADHLVIHQAGLVQSSRTGCLIFRFLLFSAYLSMISAPPPLALAYTTSSVLYCSDWVSVSKLNDGGEAGFDQDS